jgi:glycosyltransferase involved in cell wall biosynthesis
MEKPKILWVWTTNPGVTYYRMYGFAKKMDEMGLAHSQLYPEWNTSKFTSPTWEQTVGKDFAFWEDSIAWADLVVMQYIGTPTGLSLVEAIRDRKPCLMEFDDCFNAIPAYSVAYEANRPGDSAEYWATRQMMESTGAVTTTKYLANMYRDFNQKMKVIPNCIDFNLWKSNGKEQNKRVRIGWIGGTTHEGDMKIVKPILFDLLNTFPELEVVVCSGPVFDSWRTHERMIVINKWVTIDKYPEHLKSLHFDIGIAPLRDNIFNRGKSNLRFLEYASMGIPVVASNVVPFKETPSVLCSSQDEWFKGLSELIKNEELRKISGKNCLDYVKKNYDLDSITTQYYDHLKGLL